MKKLSLAKFAIAATMAMTAASHAATIDFTSTATWAENGTGNAAFSSPGVIGAPGVTGTLAATGSVVSILPPFSTPTTANLTFNAGAACTGIPGLACNGGGIGIDRPSRLAVADQNGEIQALENLHISFAGPIQITALSFLNLSPLETMQIKVTTTTGSSTQTVTAGLTSVTPNWYQSFAFAQTNVTGLDIQGVLLSGGSLASISYVPVPGSLALLGIGALGVLGAKRRKAKA